MVQAIEVEQMEVSFDGWPDVMLCWDCDHHNH
jgi:hypothetical protein